MTNDLTLVCPRCRGVLPPDRSPWMTSADDRFKVRHICLHCGFYWRITKSGRVVPDPTPIGFWHHDGLGAALLPFIICVLMLGGMAVLATIGAWQLFARGDVGKGLSVATFGAVSLGLLIQGLYSGF